MKKLIMAAAILLFTAGTYAQTTTVQTKTTPVKAIVTKTPGSPATVQTPAAARSTVKVTTKQKMHPVNATTKVKVATTTSAARPMKSDGTPDKRYKVNEGIKKDGTPDKRYKNNKKP